MASLRLSGHNMGKRSIVKNLMVRIFLCCAIAVFYWPKLQAQSINSDIKAINASVHKRTDEERQGMQSAPRKVSQPTALSSWSVQPLKADTSFWPNKGSLWSSDAENQSQDALANAKIPSKKTKRPGFFSASEIGTVPMQSYTDRGTSINVQLQLTGSLGRERSFGQNLLFADTPGYVNGFPKKRGLSLPFGGVPWRVMNSGGPANPKPVKSGSERGHSSVSAGIGTTLERPVSTKPH
jgi:hypothetical protein